MSKKYFTYVLYSDTRKRLYIGQTNNIEKRIKEHNSGKVDSTRPYRPYRLIYLEEFNSRKESLIREKELKFSHSRRKLKSFI